MTQFLSGRIICRILILMNYIYWKGSPDDSGKWPSQSVHYTFFRKNHTKLTSTVCYPVLIPQRLNKPITHSSFSQLLGKIIRELHWPKILKLVLDLHLKLLSSKVNSKTFWESLLASVRSRWLLAITYPIPST